VYHAVDSIGRTIDSLLTAKCDAASGQTVLSQGVSGISEPSIASDQLINVDKNPQPIWRQSNPTEGREGCATVAGSGNVST